MIGKLHVELLVSGAMRGRQYYEYGKYTLVVTVGCWKLLAFAAIGLVTIDFATTDFATTDFATTDFVTIDLLEQLAFGTVGFWNNRFLELLAS
jgi:hypothetical protein